MVAERISSNNHQTVPLSKYQQLETTNQNLQRLLQEARHEKQEIEQKYRRVLKIVYNTKWERQERIDTIALIDAEEHGRYKDEQGHTRINMTDVANRVGTDDKTLKKTRDMLEQACFFECVDKKIPENGDERERVYLKSDPEKKNNFSLVERPEPRKVKEARKKYTYRCQKCLKIGTVVNSKHLRCDNEECEACGTKVFIDESYDEQLEARKEEEDTGNFSHTPDSEDPQPEDTGNFPHLLDSEI